MSLLQTRKSSQLRRYLFIILPKRASETSSRRTIQTTKSTQSNPSPVSKTRKTRVAWNPRLMAGASNTSQRGFRMRFGPMVTSTREARRYRLVREICCPTITTLSTSKSSQVRKTTIGAAPRRTTRLPSHIACATTVDSTTIIRSRQSKARTIWCPPKEDLGHARKPSPCSRRSTCSSRRTATTSLAFPIIQVVAPCSTSIPMPATKTSS